MPGSGRYVKRRGKDVENPGGYIRYLLESNAKLPEKGPGCSEQKPKTAGNPASKPRTDPGPELPVVAQREGRRRTSPYAVLWAKVSAGIRDRLQSASFQDWFEPVFIEAVTGKTVVLNVPNAFAADWLQEQYLWVIQEGLQDTGITGKAISFTSG